MKELKLAFYIVNSLGKCVLTWGIFSPTSIINNVTSGDAPWWPLERMQV